jgi:hypothetical protein
LSYSEHGRVWEDYLERVNRTIKSLALMNQICENTIKGMWFINSGIFDMVKVHWGKRELPNYQVFVSVFYKRNTIYLQSSHALSCIGFIDPSSNLNRTTYETLMRGYLFTVEPKEAEEYFKVIGTKEEESYQFKKGASFLRKKLYTDTTSEKHKNLYKMLCISAHPDIKGAARDYPEYLSNRIENNLKMILCLIYGTIQMMAECFTNFLDMKTKAVIKGSMEDIASTLGSVPLFEPDKEPYSSRIKFKRGNFLTVL